MIKIIPAVAEKKIIICDGCRVECNNKINYRMESRVVIYNYDRVQSDLDFQRDEHCFGLGSRDPYSTSKEFHLCDDCNRKIASVIVSMSSTK